MEGVAEIRVHPPPEEQIYDDLDAVLLALGGETLQVRSFLRKHITPVFASTLIHSGAAYEGHRVQRTSVTDKASSCHSNALSMCVNALPHTVIPYTGFALTDDGVWRVHSWVYSIESCCFLETTPISRLQYYGVRAVEHPDMHRVLEDWQQRENSIK